jgi:hypothetical protein
VGEYQIACLDMQDKAWDRAYNSLADARDAEMEKTKEPEERKKIWSRFDKAHRSFNRK